MSVTIALMCFNQRHFLEQSFDGAIHQDYHNIQFVFSDDRSTDGSYERALTYDASFRAKGEILFNQNVANLGLAGNLNRIQELATGAITVMFACDDISAYDRVSQLVRVFETDSSIYLVHSNALVIDDQNTPLGLWGPTKLSADYSLEQYASERAGGLLGATIAWRKELFTFFGPLGQEVKSEDKVLRLRAKLLGNVGRVDAPIIQYRVHGSNVIQKSRHRPGNSQSYLRFLNATAKDKRAYYKTNLQDIATYLEQFPETPSVASARETIRRRLAETEFELGLSEMPLTERISAVLSYASSGGRRKYVARLIAQYVFPNFWLLNRHARAEVERALYRLRGTDVSTRRWIP